MYLAQKFVCK